MYYIYTLAYPDGKVFYVGKGTYVGKGKAERMHEHELEARRGVQSRKCDVIREIEREGGEVLKQVIYETNEELDAFKREALFIKAYGGRKNLTNDTEGNISETHIHVDDADPSIISKLDIASTRLLAYYLLRGADTVYATTAEIMSGAGIKKLDTFYQARKWLELYGLIDVVRAVSHKVEENSGKATPLPSIPSNTVTSCLRRVVGGGVVVGTNVSMSLVQAEDGYTGSTNVPGEIPYPDERGKEVMLTPTLNGVYPVERGGNVIPYPTERGNDTDSLTPMKGVKDIVLRCREIDAWDTDGPITYKNSPFQVRRRAQVELVQQAYAVLFPQDKYPLTEKNARKFLSLYEDYSVDVVQQFEEVTRKKPDLQSPLSYLMRVFEREARGAQQASVPNTVHPPRTSGSIMSSAQSTPTTRPGVFESRWDGELLEPSDEWLEKAKRAQEVASSIWKGE